MPNGAQTDRLSELPSGAGGELIHTMLNRPINPWWNVAAGVIGAALSAGAIMTYAYGILARSMIADYAWHRDIVANLFGMFMFGGGIGMVALGWLIARYGIRPPAIALTLIFGLSFAAVAITPPAQGILSFLFLIIGISGAAASVMPYAVAVSGFFDARRGLALGIVVGGGGFGAILFPQIAERLVEYFGWRFAFASIGLVSGLAASAGLLFLVRTPPGALEARAAKSEAEKGPSLLLTCFRSRAFWFIALPIVAVSVATLGAISSYVFLFADRGVPTAMVTTILSVAGLAAWLGRLLVGYLLDHIFAPYLTAAVFALAAAGLLLLAFDPSTHSAFIAAAFIGLALGSEADILTFLVSRYFSLRDFSRVVGIIWVGWAWGAGGGAAAVAWSHANFASYTPAFAIFASILGAAAMLICFIGPYKFPVHAKAQPASP